MKKIAVLITCHNRRDKTIACLKSLYRSFWPKDYSFQVYLVDDGSIDGTSKSVRNLFPGVILISGGGSLYWAGGMRLAWDTALSKDNYDVFLLINDDVILDIGFISRFIKTDKYCIEKTGKVGIYSACTKDKLTDNITYGGEKIISSHFILRNKRVLPGDIPKECDFTNANILWVPRLIVDNIGIFDKKFTHGIADYDYSLRAKKEGFSIWITSGIGGICVDDHGVPWKSSNKSNLLDRIRYLKSPKGLAYNEYLFYIRRHFPMNLPYSFLMLWLKILFPFIWDISKKQKKN